jgi:CheY-like chemotaxis protein
MFAKKVLIVDDERDMHLIFKTTLSASNIDFDDAYDGSEAYQKVKAHTYDLILLDLVMPEINGFEFLDLTREDKLDLPFVIICSSMREKEIVMAALQLGASDYLFKPIEPAKLRQVVQGYLEMLKQSEVDFNRLKQVATSEINSNPTLTPAPVTSPAPLPKIDSIAKAISYMVFNRLSGKVKVGGNASTGELDYEKGKLQKVSFGAKTGIDALEVIKYLPQLDIKLEMR